MREVKETVLPNGMRLKGDPSKLKKIGQKRQTDSTEDDDHEAIAHLMSMMEDEE